MFLGGQAFAATHTVSKGESLWLIGRWYGVETRDIIAVNGLPGTGIYPGQKLFIPDRVPATAGVNTYTVKSGDTLFLIARRFGTSADRLKALNGLKGTTVHPGQKLAVPSGGGASSSRGSVTGSISDRDFEVLARLITAEAADQNYETQVAVGAVVLNRVRSGLFPSTIPGVVYQVDEGGRYQFEPVLNGWINRPPSETAKKAARDALNGWDPTGGALYFWESWVKNQFLNSKPVSRIMGAFTFTY